MTSLALTLLSGCDSPHLSFLWKAFEHPTYRFSVRVPPGWEVRKDDVLGVAVSLVAPEAEGSFKTNANVVVTPRRESLPLQKVADEAVSRLTLVLAQYKVVGQMNTKLSDLPALEIRAKYFAPEGTRVVRTVLALSPETQFVVTFTTREDTEDRFAPIFEAIRRSFRVAQT